MIVPGIEGKRERAGASTIFMFTGSCFSGSESTSNTAATQIKIHVNLDT